MVGLYLHIFRIEFKWINLMNQIQTQMVFKLPMNNFSVPCIISYSACFQIARNSNFLESSPLKAPPDRNWFRPLSHVIKLLLLMLCCSEGVTKSSHFHDRELLITIRIESRTKDTPEQWSIFNSRQAVLELLHGLLLLLFLLLHKTFYFLLKFVNICS